ncbi:MAG: hypothetical protein AAF944_21105 [Bacteroidota bacterium]
MKEQISKEETDLKTTYVLGSLIPVFTGTLFLSFIYLSDSTFVNEVFIKHFSGGCLALGFLFLFVSIIFIPYCYKIEVDDNNIYITKSEIIITTRIENTITIDKDKLKSVSGSFLGLSIFNSEYRLYYLIFSEETEFGKKIAFLSKRVTTGREYLELRKLKKQHWRK